MSLYDRVEELEQLNDCRSRQLARAESTIDTLKASNNSLRRSYDREVTDMKSENIAMKEKMNRMTELSAENLLLAADAADLQGELVELRQESRDLRNRCFELTEDNRSLKMEVRDLRRHIECLKGRPVDPRQELLEKIEYYRAEHDRLLEEVRGMKRRLGEVTPKSPRSRSPAVSPRRNKTPYQSKSPRRQSPNRGQAASKGVRFSDEQPERTSAGDSLAAVTATMLAADRVTKDRSLSPSVALNLRDLTMERYQKHMEGESPRSQDTDNTELLLKPSITDSREKAPICARQLELSDDDQSEEFNETSKPSYLIGASRSRSPHRGLDRNCDGDRIVPTSRSRSTSPALGASGYRSLSPRSRPVPHPRATSEKSKKPITDYPPEIQRTLPRRAFAPRNPSDLRLGYSIKFTRPGGKIGRGNVKYVGHLPGRSEVFVGVESEDLDGKHCGTFQGVKYFSCSPNRGIFTPFSKIIMAYE